MSKTIGPAQNRTLRCPRCLVLYRPDAGAPHLCDDIASGEVWPDDDEE